MRAISHINIKGASIDSIVDDILITEDKIKIIFVAKNLSRDEMNWIESKSKDVVSSATQINHNNIIVIFTDEIPQQPTHQRNPIKGVKKIILVASGKGGVGKSTVASVLALSLAQSGLKVGLLDADIYGPSIPELFQIQSKPEISPDDRLLPFDVSGVKIMSMGFLVAQEKALIWRGPMLTKALHQLTHGVDWRNHDGSDLDFLLIDTPPGTGDIHLSLGTKYQIDGVIFVSTPQSLAINDTIKSISMFQELKIPVIGLVENMGSFADNNGKLHYLFGNCNLESYCKDNGINFLGSIPVQKEISEEKALFKNIKIICEAFKSISENLKSYL